MPPAAVLRKGKALHLKGLVEAEGQFELRPDLLHSCAFLLYGTVLFPSDWLYIAELTQLHSPL